MAVRTKFFESNPDSESRSEFVRRLGLGIPGPELMTLGLVIQRSGQRLSSVVSNFPVYRHAVHIDKSEVTRFKLWQSSSHYTSSFGVSWWQRNSVLSSQIFCEVWSLLELSHPSHDGHDAVIWGWPIRQWGSCAQYYIPTLQTQVAWGRNKTVYLTLLTTCTIIAS